MTAVVACPNCSHEYTVQIVVGDAARPPSDAPTEEGFAWYKRGEAVNESAVADLRLFLAMQPEAIRITLDRLYAGYLKAVENETSPPLSKKNFSTALRDLGHVPYRTSDARGFVLGGPEAAARAVSGRSWQANAARAVELANELRAATMAGSEQDSQTEASDEAGTEPEAP